MLTDYQILLPGSHTMTDGVTVKPPPLVKNFVVNAPDFRKQYEDDNTYICSDCGSEMTQNLIMRQNKNYTPILTCHHCHVTIEKPRRSPRG